ncbi:MAG TPA: excinuclease ABC subunit UvrA [Phycisphaerae bacterium]|nr:excinuclease ABC subunit UvrA [Phycisphaerae bacterium]
MATRTKKKKSKPAADVTGASSANGNASQKWLSILGARRHNLKNVNAHFPLGRFVCVTGVSGSGKSSLVNDILYRRLALELNGAEKLVPGAHDDIVGLEHLDKVIDIDQAPIGRTPRSNPSTYIKVFDEIRRLFAQTADSKVRGYKPSRFSFNVQTGEKGGGRCDGCDGNGANKMEMDFLADVWVTCPICEGHRFNRETLQIRFKGKNIADVLEMDVQEALNHFENIPKIADMLRTLHDVGLDYVKLGQSSTTLSGGEAQRIKLARELVKRSTGQTLYLLDEPTTGLHFADIRRLLEVLHGFVDAGNTVVVVEHNVDVIKTADWIIDLGPEGGAGGGLIVATGTPEELAKSSKSETGAILRDVLDVRRKSNASIKKAAGRKTSSTLHNRITDIEVTGARQNNLKDVHVRIPREKTTVFCGPSGSGKSTLAIDTIYAEGQRRYVESLSSYARQFLGQMEKPRVDHVTGLSPAISIEQKAPSRSPRSTVGTVTEIHDYMRVLWSRIGTPHCPKCLIKIGTQTTDEILTKVMDLPAKTKAIILAPIRRSGNETYAAMFEREQKNGFRRARVDGVVFDLDQPIDVDHRKRHDVELVVDRVVIDSKSKSRIADSIEHALSIGGGLMLVQIEKPSGKKSEDLRFSQFLSCQQCGQSYEELTPHHYSFNTRLGWCPVCEGLGTQRGASPAAVITHPLKSILDGAVGAWGELRGNDLLTRAAHAVADRIGFDISKPWNRLSEGQRIAFLQGAGDEWIELDDGLRIRWRGFFPAIDRATKVGWKYRKQLADLVTEVPCESCHGTRLIPQARETRLSLQTIHDVCSMRLGDALGYFKNLKLTKAQRTVAGELLHEIKARLTFLVDVGLDYLSLARSAPTLSGGESQRIRLASQIGSGLTGVLYVLDEPTIGLHPRDNGRLIEALQKLRALGNTLMIVEHDREVIQSADHVLDFGPAAGEFGGTITAAASPKALEKKRASLTGKYLSGKNAIAVPANRLPVDPKAKSPVPDRWLTVKGAYHNNLREIDAAFPLGRFVCVVGVSGSGKSSLVTEVLYKALAARIHRARLVAGGHHRIEGLDHVDKVINVDQSPIGNSPASNAATYTGAFDLVRELFARLADSRIRGYTANRFSFNRAGGRCEACAGYGKRCIEMHFLPDVWIPCEACGGTRYTADTLEVKYKGKSIADVLDMSVAEALEHFKNVPRLKRVLQTLADVGLDYLKLGQGAPTLSGGEAQRVKLAAELSRPSTGRTVYILDEPTTGLHFDDLKKLLRVLHRLVDMGNTVICIEHNLDVIKSCDWVMELGPEAGDEGGELVAACTPEALVERKSSLTGAALKDLLQAGPVETRKIETEAAGTDEPTIDEKILEDAQDVEMPWQVDGRKWHLENQLDYHGQRPKWDAKVLSWAIKTIESLADFAPTNWNDQAYIEIKANGSKTPWFLHALTRSSVHLYLSLRVPKGAFDEAALQKQLKIKTLDERDDLPFYSNEDRVRVRNINTDWDSIRIQVHDEKDIDKPVMKRFFKKAADAYLEKIGDVKENPKKGEPWKVDPKNWHLNHEAMKRRNKTARWSKVTLLDIIGKISKFAPKLTFDWAQNVGIRVEYDRKRVGLIVTNMPKGIRVHLRMPLNTVTPTQIERLGTSVEVKKHGDFDEVQFWLAQPADTDPKQLKTVLKHVEAYGESRKG